MMRSDRPPGGFDPDAPPPPETDLDDDEPSSAFPLAASDTAPPPFRSTGTLSRINRSVSLQLLVGLLLTGIGLVARLPWLTLPAAAITLALALRQLLPPLWRQLTLRIDDVPTTRLLALVGLVLAALAIPVSLGWWDPFLDLYRKANWEAISALGEGVIGAVGQILVALVALAIAWRQVMVDQRLTGQQNRITQAQTIDSFIHGISEMIIDEEGLLEDWPLERMLAEGRLAAVLSSIDREGKARVLRFLSHARLLTPLQRDRRLGRAILDGRGNYEIDRFHGVPVIRLHRILRGVDLSGTDLRGIDFNGADLSGADLSGCDLRDCNLAGANLAGANLEGSDLEGVRLYFGRAHTASPAGLEAPDPVTGSGTGAVVENINLTSVRRLDAQSHHYLAAWSGARSRQTLPGGARGVPSQLDRRAGNASTGGPG
jgi:uncharacterized protein YjbI with pentapeptide repeats